MNTADFLNLAGLAFITVGSICAARSAPTTTYGPDGTVALTGPDMSGDENLPKRVAMHHRQKRFPQFLWMIAVGAVFQAMAVLVA